MIKKQIVIGIPSGDDKGGSKALKTASTMKGVVSVEIVRERNHLVVTGVGVDSVELTRSLRRIFGIADIVSVTDILSEYHETSREQPFFRQDNFRSQGFGNYIYRHPHTVSSSTIAPYIPVYDPDPMCSIM